jgi:hypothetical protein
MALVVLAVKNNVESLQIGELDDATGLAGV